LIPFWLGSDLSPFKPFPGHHTWGRSPGPVPNEPRHDGEQPPTHRRRCRGRSRPEIAMEADGSSECNSNFQFRFLLRFSTKSIEWKTLGMVKLQGRLCRIFGKSRKRI
ncbi:Ankyrin repeat family protein, partial [Prunus dulcis]